MAEAVVDGTSMSRFFCHKCSVEIERLLPDYTCPQCSSGFIEELEDDSNDDISGMDTSDEDLSDIEVNLNNLSTVERNLLITLGLPAAGQGTGNRVNNVGSRRRTNVTRHVPGHIQHSSSFLTGQEELTMSDRIMINEFVMNPTRFLTVSPLSLGVRFGQLAAYHNGLSMGNPGDYVWGGDGWDAIVTHLLNQMDGAGPPPLPRKQIDKIPTLPVTQTQVERKLQCSVCWEDFKLSEPVRQLPCQHFYHAPCIVPWLELHGTCPICRQSLGDQTSAEANRDTVGPTLAALFRAANESNSSRTSSTSTTSSSTSSSTANN